MLGLKRPTDPSWARIALSNLDAVLVDHAHCEMKAASHAMSLATRHPHDLKMVLALIDLAREELDHFAQVVKELARRGIELGPPPIDDYAAELRKRVRSGELADRLIIAALIEARSCERFKLLLEAMKPDHPMYAFYTELFEAEARHYRTFVDLAIAAHGDEAEIRARLDRALEIEAEIIAGIGPPSPVVHG